MYSKIYRYHVLEKDYPAWLKLARASNAIYVGFEGVSFRQTPMRKMGGVMEIEEVVIYPDKETSEEIALELQKNPQALALSDACVHVIYGPIQEEAIGD